MQQIRIPSTRRFIIIASILAALFTACMQMHAAAPIKRSQAPGYYRIMIGSFEVTALCDGAIAVGKKLLTKATEQELDALMAPYAEGGAATPSTTNAYLVNTGSKLVLIDAGAGTLFGPSFGYTLKNLRAAGYAPEDVDAVLITHLHPDHVGGIADSTGKANFPNATVYVSKPESDFWLSEREDAESQDMKEMRALVKKNASAYQASKKWITCPDGDQPVSGITALVKSGHTPGHASFLIASDTASLLVIGDMIHNMPVQCARPDVAIEYDTDQEKAVAVRQEAFQRAAAEHRIIAGMHLPFPGIGRLHAESASKDRVSYRWIPVVFSPDL